MNVAEKAPRLWGLWLAARPSQLALIALVYVLGVGTARALTAAAAQWTEVIVGAVAVMAVAVSIHYANEYVDVETDQLTDPTRFSGGSGAVERTGVDRSLLLRASTGSLGIGLAVGVAGLATGVISATAVGMLVAIAGAGLAYSVPPVALIRRGVGELTNAVLGGFFLPVYGITVVGQVSLAAVLTTVPFTVLVGCNLLATHWPDREADAAVGKRTLAVRWPPSRLRRAYWGLAGVAVLATVALAGRVVPLVVVAAQALALPPLLWGGVVLTRQRSPVPAVSAMVVHAGASSVAWWRLALA